MPGMDCVVPMGEKEQRRLLPGEREACSREAQGPTSSLGCELKEGECGGQGRGKAEMEVGDRGDEGQLTIVDPRHGRHPEVRAVLVVESVAVPIHWVVEVRVITIQERESGVREESAAALGKGTFSSLRFLITYYVPTQSWELFPCSLRHSSQQPVKASSPMSQKRKLGLREV